MIFIKKLFIGKPDEEVHRQFSRFGKGIYENRALMNIKKAKDLTIKSSFEYSNDFVKLIAENAKGEIDVSGIIVMFKNFKFRDFEISKRGNIYKCDISLKCCGIDLLKIYDEFKEGWLLLKLKSENYSLSCSSSLPKPGGELKDNFCSAKFDLKLKDEFAWDIGDFKTLKISHKLNILSIEVPKEYANDLIKARYYARRKGKIIRELNIDGKKEVKEKDFFV